MIEPMVTIKHELSIKEKLSYLFEYGHFHISQVNLDRLECFEKELEYKRESQGCLSPEDLETLSEVLYYKTQLLFKLA